MRKYIALILSVIFVISCLQVHAADTSAALPESNDDYNILTELGIIQGYDDGAFKLEEQVSRAEFAMLMTMLIGMDGLESTPEMAIFYDVPVAYWASGYINLAYRLGLMNGTSETTFEPEGSISIEQASKVLVKIAGYGELAEVSGGYPTGYMMIASRNEITDGVYNTVLTRADVLRLMMNVLELEALEETSFTEDSVKFKEGKTLFERYHGIRQLEGQVVSTGDASIYGEALTDEYFVRIDDADYNADGKDYFSLLGQTVEFYVDEDDTLLHMKPNGESEIVTIKAEDIDKNETEFTKSGAVKLVYYSDERKETINLSHETGYIVNNRPYKPPFKIENVAPGDGQITLVDGNNDGDYETVITDSYITIVAKSVNSYDGFITDELGQHNLNDLNELDKTVKVIKNGKEIKYGELASGNVLLVKISQDDEYIEILAADQTVTGKLTGFSESDEEIIIDGNTYKPNPNFDFSSLKLGESHTYCLDSFGRVAWIDDSKVKNTGYAYLFGAKLSGMNDHMDIKILGGDGKIEELSTKESKIKFNGKKTSIENICASLCDSEGKAIEQVIIVNKDAEGYIDSIKAGSEISLDYQPAARSYSSGQKLFGAYEPDGFAISDSTPVFIIYPDLDDCKIMPITSLQDKTEYNTVEGYNGKETFICEAVVIRPQGGSDSVPFDYSTPFGVIEDTFETLDSEGDVVSGFKIFVKGVTVSLKLTDKAFATKIKMPGALQTPIQLSDLNPGDVVQYNLNMNGDIENIGRLFPYETGSDASSEPEFVASHGWSRERTFGTVWRIVGDYMSLRVNNEYYTFMIRNAPITVYDYEEEECREGSAGDLIDYETDPERASKVFISSNNGQIYDFIVFKN